MLDDPIGDDDVTGIAQVSPPATPVENVVRKSSRIDRQAALQSRPCNFAHAGGGQHDSARQVGRYRKDLRDLLAFRTDQDTARYARCCRIAQMTPTGLTAITFGRNSMLNRRSPAAARSPAPRAIM